jgi:hypothetical protein
VSWWEKDATKVIAIFLAVLTLVTIFFLGLSIVPASQEFLNANEHPVAIVITLAFIIGGLLAWFRKDKKEQRQSAAEISSVGMAALVDPLLEIGLNFSALRAEPSAVAGEWDQAKKGPKAPSRLKWDYGESLRGQALVEWNPPASWVKDEIDPYLQTAIFEMSDQAVRRLMGSLRSWADLLSVTSFGQTAMVALADLRLRLFSLSEECRSSTSEGWPPRNRVDNEKIAKDISDCANRALILAMIFEACGGAEKPRLGFGHPLDEWRLPDWTGGLELWRDPFRKNCKVVSKESGNVPASVDKGLSLLEAYGRELISRNHGRKPMRGNRSKKSPVSLH